jgi:hypothetical protein
VSPTPQELAAHALRVKGPALAHAAADALYRARPELARRYAHLGDAGRRHCVNDLGHHLRFLAAAVDVADSKVFTDYAAWACRVMVTHKVAPDDALASFRCLLDVVPPAVDAEAAGFVRATIHAAVRLLEQSAGRVGTGGTRASIPHP